MLRQIVSAIRKARSSNGASAAAIVIAVAIFIKTAVAVHDTGRFQLDGDASSFTNTVGTPSASDDWDKVCNEVTGGGVADCGTTSVTTGSPANAVAWTTDNLVGDGPSSNATTFTGGGSKDPIDINNWAWSDGVGGLPDKDNLLHAFAVRYSLAPTPPGGSCPNGTGGVGQPPFDSTKPCVVLFFGSDRLDNSGDAQQGFWFFQNAIGLGSNKVGGGTGFTGVHRLGDLLIVSDFSIGGTTSTITVYTWDPACTATNKPFGFCADANLHLQATSTAANCATAAPNDAFCGLVNPSTITMPWSFTDKSGTINNGALNGEFYEAGINLSVIGLSGECFSTVGAETRSSTSTTATLKDFILARFGNCTSGLTTTPKDAAGAAIPAGGLSIGTGSVSVKDEATTLTITGASTWTGTLTFFLCGPTALGSPFSACTGGGTQIGAPIPVSNATTFPILSNSAQLTSAGGYCWRGEFTSGTSGVPNATDATLGECFTVNPVVPFVPTQASADVQLGNPVSDLVNLNGTANQPGSPVINGPLGAPAGGTITFRLFGPNDTSCANPPVFTSAAIPVSGDALYFSGNFTPTQVGTYRWIASYSGNSPNTLATTGVCNAANESVVVNATPAISTAQTFTVKDSATITVAAGAGTLQGSLDFQLYSTSNCSGGLLFDSGPISVSGPSPQTRETITTTITAPGQPTLSWLVVYTNTAPNQAGVTSTCNTEGASLSIHNQ